MPKTNDLRGKLILLAVSILVCIIIAEFAARLLWTDQRNGYPQELFTPDEILGYKLTPNYSGEFVMNAYSSIPISINSKGLRDREFEYKKADKVRILVLGDSLAFGAGVRINKTFEKQLESSLIEAGYPFEIINSGVSGYQFDQEFNYYFKEGYKYNSDIVLVAIVLNDIQEVSPEKARAEWFESYSDNSIKLLIRDNCRICKFSYSLIKDFKQSREEYNDLYFKEIYSLWENNSSFNHYKEKVEILNANLTLEGKKLILAIFPYTQQFNSSRNYGTIPQQKILQLSSENNIMAVDLLPALDSPRYKEYYFPHDNVHPTAEGHKLIKEVLFEKITQLMG